MSGKRWAVSGEFFDRRTFWEMSNEWWAMSFLTEVLNWLPQNESRNNKCLLMSSWTCFRISPRANIMTIDECFTADRCWNEFSMTAYFGLLYRKEATHCSPLTICPSAFRNADVGSISICNVPVTFISCRWWMGITNSLAHDLRIANAEERIVAV